MSLNGGQCKNTGLNASIYLNFLQKINDIAVYSMGPKKKPNNRSANDILNYVYR